MRLDHRGRWFALFAFAVLPAGALAAHPFSVPLKDAAGSEVTSASTAPYSPEKSCGGCHDIRAMAQGYHFQQGRTDGAARIQVSDTFLGALIGAYDTSGNATKGTGAWWKLSDGMYGKW